MVGIGSIWLRIGTVGGLMWTRWWTSGFHKMLGNSRVAAQLAASQEGLSSMSQWVRVIGQTYIQPNHQPAKQVQQSVSKWDCLPVPQVAIKTAKEAVNKTTASKWIFQSFYQPAKQVQQSVSQSVSGNALHKAVLSWAPPSQPAAVRPEPVTPRHARVRGTGRDVALFACAVGPLSFISRKNSAPISQRLFHVFFPFFFFFHVYIFVVSVLFPTEEVCKFASPFVWLSTSCPMRH
jgi:hypothetical protein